MKYTVMVTDTSVYAVTVEAANADEARDMALDVMAETPGLPTCQAELLDPRVDVVDGQFKVYDVQEVATEKVDCPTCGGTGIDRRFGMERGCQDCRGTGRKGGA